MQNKLLFSKDEFYDKKETKATPGQYNPSPVSQRRKRRKSDRNFRLSFGCEQVTQVGGYPMLEKEYSSFALRRKLSRGLRKKRGANGFTLWNRSLISLLLIPRGELPQRYLSGSLIKRCSELSAFTMRIHFDLIQF